MRGRIAQQGVSVGDDVTKGTTGQLAGGRGGVADFLIAQRS
jgi:hypothetical protein